MTDLELDKNPSKSEVGKKIYVTERIVNILGFSGYTVLVEIIQLCGCSTRVVTDPK